MVGCAHGAQAELDGAIDIVLDVSEAVEHRGVGMYVQGCETAVGGGAGHASSGGRRGRLRCGAPLGVSMQVWLLARLWEGWLRAERGVVGGNPVPGRGFCGDSRGKWRFGRVRIQLWGCTAVMVFPCDCNEKWGSLPITLS